MKIFYSSSEKKVCLLFRNDGNDNGDDDDDKDLLWISVHYVWLTFSDIFNFKN